MNIFHFDLFKIPIFLFGFSSRVNTNILTRRLCRNRSCDDNELYRSNSFKFERFRREDTDAATVSVNTLPKQVSKWLYIDWGMKPAFYNKKTFCILSCAYTLFKRVGLG